MVIKLNSRGEDVKKIQSVIGCGQDGIFGKTTEKSVKNWQKNHGLTADGIVGNETWYKMFGTYYGQLNKTVLYNPISVHITKSNNRQIKYLVIHYTAGKTSKPGTAASERKVFLNCSSSADFCVDDRDIIQINPDPRNNYCWAVGDGKGKYGVTNANSIHIEMCSYLDNGTNVNIPNHCGWHVTDAVVDKTVALAKDIMKEYNIPLKNVIRHYDASKKLCPGIIGWNDGVIYDAITGKATSKKNNNTEWDKFKSRLS